MILHGMVSRLSDRWAIPVVLAGFGLIRLGVEPMRATPPLGEPVVPIVAIAAVWVGLGIAMAVRSAGEVGAYRQVRSEASRGIGREEVDPMLY